MYMHNPTLKLPYNKLTIIYNIFYLFKCQNNQHQDVGTPYLLADITDDMCKHVMYAPHRLYRRQQWRPHDIEM